MARRWNQLPFKDEVARLLAERSISQRALARELGVNQGWLSHALNGDRPFPPELIQRMASLLGVEPSHFVEYRRAILIQAVEQDTKLLDRLYRLIPRV